MALLRLASRSLEVAGRGVALGALAVVDEITQGGVPAVSNARRDQERGIADSVRDVQADAQTVGNDVARVARTVGASAEALARIALASDQRTRLLELVETFNLLEFLHALTPREQLPPDFFPKWIRRAGGYFPKLAQVLSVRADLIHDRAVLEQLAKCMEEMPLRPASAVRDQLAGQGWPADVCRGVGEGLNAGSVAQVNELTLPDGRRVVVKVAWLSIKQQMQTDFRLFEHAKNILSALRLDDEKAQSVAAMFAAVGRNEAAVMREFDLREEARAQHTARALCVQGGEWEATYEAIWRPAAESALQRLPPPLGDLAMEASFGDGAHGGRIAVPAPVDGFGGETVLAMERAGGESLQALLTGEAVAGQRQAAGAFLGRALPFIGWLLLCKSSEHLAHVDPHPGNFRWDAASRTLWVLDWGSNVKLSEERRRALCLIVLQLSADTEQDDGAIADAARVAGLRADDEGCLARLMREIMNASPHRSAQDALNSAAVDGFLRDVDDDVVPVVRCLATLGGILKEVQRRIRDRTQADVPLSLAALWRPFAILGMED